jgi:1,2-phenylacetyl-CoA epoxidase PaaB subunit
MMMTQTKKTYFAVFVQHDKKARSRFLCNVLATGEREAVGTARRNGLSVGRRSYAIRIGRDGYRQALAAAFPPLQKAF